MPEPVPRKTIPKGETRARGWLFWVLVIGIPFAVLSYLGLIIGAGLLFGYASKHLPVSDEERAVIIDTRDLEEWIEDLSIAPDAEQLTKVRYIDRSYEIAYEYDSPDGVDPLYLNCTVNIERNLADALATYLPLWTATRIGFSVSAETEIRVEEREEFFDWGDQSRFAVLFSDSQPIGNLFIARHDEKVFYLVLVGVYFDEPPHWAEFIAPTLERLSRYRPD